MTAVGSVVAILWSNQCIGGGNSIVWIIVQVVEQYHSGQCGRNTLGDTLDSGSRNNLVGVVLVV